MPFKTLKSKEPRIEGSKQMKWNRTKRFLFKIREKFIDIDHGQRNAKIPVTGVLAEESKNNGAENKYVY